MNVLLLGFVVVLGILVIVATMAFIFDWESDIRLRHKRLARRVSRSLRSK